MNNNIKINRAELIDFDNNLYLTGEYEAFDVSGLAMNGLGAEKVDIVSVRYNKTLGWRALGWRDDLPLMLDLDSIKMRKKARVIWVNVIRNRHGIIFSRTTETKNTKPQSGNVMIKQYELEVRD
jgi:hypothetical protein